MNLGKSILDVLRYHPEVAVPGIGVFKKTHFAASYYAKEQVFLPPYDQIDLVGEGENTIGLADYLQLHHQLGSEEATMMLENTLNDVFSALNAGKTVYLDGLGSLENDRNVLKFSPLEMGKLGYGVMAEKPAADGAIPAPLVPEPADEQPASKGWMWVMGLFLLAAIIGGVWFVNPNLFQPSGTEEEHTDANTTQQVAQPGADVVLATDSTQATEETPAAESPERLALLGNILNPDAGLPTTTFEIIIGTFRTIDEAAEYMQRLKDQGHGQVRILAIEPGSRLHKVSWGAYATREDGQAVLREVQQRIERGAWLDQVNR